MKERNIEFEVVQNCYDTISIIQHRSCQGLVQVAKEIKQMLVSRRVAY